MADNSKIEWTEATWNPVTGCTEVSSGCDNCYAKTFAERWRGIPGHHFENGFDVTLRPERLDQPLRWKRPRLIFVNSMSDLFHDAVPDLFIEQVFDVMEQAKQHTFQVLTKRHARMRSFVTAREQRRIEYAEKFDHCPTEAMRNSPAARWARERAVTPPANIWLGVSVEDQKWADIRIPALLETPAAVRWLSCEPLLGPVHLPEFVVAGDPNCPCESGADCKPNIDWIVCGGESGPGARPMRTEWARSLRDQSIEGGIPFLFKQWGAWVAPSQMPEDTFMNWDVKWGSDMCDTDRDQWRFSKKDAGRLLDGREWNEYPRQSEQVTA